MELVWSLVCTTRLETGVLVWWVVYIYTTIPVYQFEIRLKTHFLKNCEIRLETRFCIFGVFTGMVSEHTS